MTVALLIYILYILYMNIYVCTVCTVSYDHDMIQYMMISYHDATFRK